VAVRRVWGALVVRRRAADPKAAWAERTVCGLAARSTAQPIGAEVRAEGRSDGEYSQYLQYPTRTEGKEGARVLTSACAGGRKIARRRIVTDEVIQYMRAIAPQIAVRRVAGAVSADYYSERDERSDQSSASAEGGREAGKGRTGAGVRAGVGAA
jgi:hypothetical protein